MHTPITREDVLPVKEEEWDDLRRRWFTVTDHWPIETNICPEHGTEARSLTVVCSTSEFCEKCATQLAALERKPVAPVCEWTRTDEQMRRAEEDEQDYFAELEEA